MVFKNEWFLTQWSLFPHGETFLWHTTIQTETYWIEEGTFKKMDLELQWLYEKKKSAQNFRTKPTVNYYQKWRGIDPMGLIAPWGKKHLIPDDPNRNLKNWRRFF